MSDVALTGLIEARAGIRSGKPCFVGTRITVDDVVEYLASGMTAEAIVVDFPELTIEHVEAARVTEARRQPRGHAARVNLDPELQALVERLRTEAPKHGALPIGPRSPGVAAFDRAGTPARRAFPGGTAE